MSRGPPPAWGGLFFEEVDDETHRSLFSSFSPLFHPFPRRADQAAGDLRRLRQMGSRWPRPAPAEDSRRTAAGLPTPSTAPTANNELRIAKLADGTTKIAAFGAQPAYSADSKWLAYSIGQSEAEQEKLRSEQKPVQNKLGLMNLATGEMARRSTASSRSPSVPTAPTWPCSATRPLALGRPPRLPAPGAGPAPRPGRTPPRSAPGTTLIVRQLADGRDTTFGNVSQFAWQDAERTHLLAMIISAEGKTGNGVQLFDPETDLPARAGFVVLGLYRSRLAEGRGRPGRLPGQDRRAQGWPDAGPAAWTEIGTKSERARILRPDGRFRVPGRVADGHVPPALLVGRRQNALSRDGQVGRQARAPGQGG